MNLTPWSTYAWIKDVTGIQGCKGRKDPTALHHRSIRIGSNMFSKKFIINRWIKKAL